MLEKRIIELLTRKMAGELSAEELVELNELLLKYPEAVHEEQIFKDIWNGQAVDEDIAPFYEHHKEKFDGVLFFDSEKEPVSAGKTRINFYRYFLVACILIAAAGSLYFFYNGSNQQEHFKQIIAGKGVRKSITLPDGTKVWLNGDSKLSYDPTMTKAKTRLVHLSGEAYFDVAHDKAHPFVIVTDKISIKVLGTAFNVKAYPNDKKCETTLIRGSVELTVNDESKQKFILKPSEKLALIEEKEEKELLPSTANTKGETLLIEHVNPVKIEDKEYIAETSWTENHLVIENETMKELAPKLERWYNLKIQLNNKEISDYHFTGTFTNESIEQVLIAMNVIKSFNYKINNNEVIIF